MSGKYNDTDGRYVSRDGQELPWQEFGGVTTQLAGDEACVMIRGDTQGLLTISCDRSHAFICERSRKLSFTLSFYHFE